MRTQRKLPILATVLLMAAVVIAPLAQASSFSIKSVDWTYQTVSGNSNYWTACTTLNNNKSPSNQAYTFQYVSFTQTGTTDSSGCFTVRQADVGVNFGYGSGFSLKVGSSAIASLSVTTTRTLGAEIVPVTGGLVALVQTINLVSVTAAVLAIGSVGAYVIYKRR